MANEIADGLRQLLRGRRVAVALSGGRDSVVLLDALVATGVDVRAAHIDHGLRADSAADARFCADIAANHGIPFAIARLSIRRGNSTQGRARVQRYGALARLCSELGADTLAVGHHADDAWESSLLQAARGAGVVGRAGPQLWADWHGLPIVRPMLNRRSAAIEEYALERQLSWREDPSNRSRAYARSRLRQESAHPFDSDALVALGRDAARLSARTAAVFRRHPGPTRVSLDRGDLEDAELTARVLIDVARGLHGELPWRLTAELIDALVSGTTGRFCGRRVVVTITRDSVILDGTRGQGTRLMDATSTAEIALLPEQAYPWFDHRIATRSGTQDEHAALPLRTVEGVSLRGPCPSDRIEVLGLGGTRAVHDVLADAKVAPVDRWRWPCLFAGERCLWVCGLRRAEPDPTFLLPPGSISGIFVRWELLNPRVSAHVAAR